MLFPQEALIDTGMVTKDKNTNENYSHPAPHQLNLHQWTQTHPSSGLSPKDNWCGVRCPSFYAKFAEKGTW